MSKAQWERRHAKERAWERYGIELRLQDLNRIVEDIKAGRSQPVRKVSNTRSVHDVKIGSRTIRVAYDRKRGQVVTVLPPPELKR